MINIKQLNPQKDILVIFGATASGKSDLAIKLAKELNGVILNADASQIYKEAPILSNLPSQADLSLAPHKLFAYLSLVEESSVVNWLNLCVKEINLAKENQKLPVVVGGSGMYISSLINGISDIPSNPQKKQEAIETHNTMGYEKFLSLLQKIDPSFTNKVSDAQRLIRAYEVYLYTGKPFSFYQNQPKVKYANGNFINVFLNPNRELLYEKINLRTKQMFAKNILGEATNILKLTENEIHHKKILGLKEIISYIKNENSLEFTIDKIQQKTRNYAKRQITWFTHQIQEKITIKNGDEFFNKKS
ncbi:MAG: tRNA (adenosine(37)-N6)-dimethylallyltransferase MiaA [Alphaproteobacteria bacterium]|jgi:tRNA dimethylallyltransferase|nr:tRNA (adenosine(37)-N6)-dimethylallyltransferase MiaA [Alphaproteobacteria bacterium]